MSTDFGVVMACRECKLNSLHLTKWCGDKTNGIDRTRVQISLHTEFVSLDSFGAQELVNRLRKIFPEIY